MWAWTASLGVAALATRFIPFREGGVWHPWETVAVVAIALFALAFSVYIVYLLEIVKLGNPRVRRRLAEQAARSAARPEAAAPGFQPVVRASSARTTNSVSVSLKSGCCWAVWP